MDVRDSTWQPATLSGLRDAVFDRLTATDLWLGQNQQNTRLYHQSCALTAYSDVSTLKTWTYTGADSSAIPPHATVLITALVSVKALDAASSVPSVTANMYVDAACASSVASPTDQVVNDSAGVTEHTQSVLQYLCLASAIETVKITVLSSTTGYAAVALNVLAIDIPSETLSGTWSVA